MNWMGSRVSEFKRSVLELGHGGVEELSQGVAAVDAIEGWAGPAWSIGATRFNC